MVTRVMHHLEPENLPAFDSMLLPELLLERLVSNSLLFSALDKKKSEEIMGQGRFILHCAMRWFLTTGRHPLPIVAAVLAFVADVNGLVVSVEEIAREIHAGISTSRIRLKELLEVLVKASKALLPWGNDVTVKNIVHHAPVLIRLMELKSKTKSNPIGDGNACVPNLAINLDDILNAYSNYSGVTEEESKYFKLGERDGDDQRLGRDELKRLKLSGEQISISHAYSQVLDILPGICNERDSENVYGSKRRRAGLELQDWIEPWEGRWKSDRGLNLEQVLQRSEGYDTLPPSFINGIDLRWKRRMKIEAAKHRIHKIQRRTPDIVEVEPSKGEDGRPITLLPSRKRRKKDGMADELDWEDSIIELLLLRQVEEEEILQGHYNRLMDVYVFSFPES